MGLVIPVAAFLESSDHEPVRQTDGTWVWSYNFNANTVLHLAQLHGKDGRVSDPDHYEDTARHCWDTTLEDIECE